MKTAIKRLAILTLVTLLIVGQIFSPLNSEELQNVIRSLPLLVFSLVVSEAIFMAGLVIMVISAGKKIGNPLTLRSRIDLKKDWPQLVTGRMFWLGFWLNALGAVGTAVCIIIAICVGVPARIWSILAIPVIDLGATIALRIWVWRRIAELSE